MEGNANSRSIYNKEISPLRGSAFVAEGFFMNIFLGLSRLPIGQIISS
jgi:hypothetical protein